MRERGANVIYDTIRLIEQDTESYLAWAKQPYACIIFNLHVTHTGAEIAKAADGFRALIDLAIQREGSYYLTYHKWASKEQLTACYPEFETFMQQKQAYDRNEVFQSDGIVIIKHSWAANPSTARASSHTTANQGSV